MERFYYDQDCEFRQRPFEVATYGEIVPFIVTLTQDAYGYIWNERCRQDSTTRATTIKES